MVSMSATTTALALCGAGCGLGLWLLLMSTSGQVSLPPIRLRGRLRNRQTRQMAVCVAIGLAVAVVARIPMMGLLVAALLWVSASATSGPSIPVITATGDAIASWAETVRQELEAGQPLRAAIVAACDDPPPPIAVPLTRLAARLETVALPEALWELRAAVDHPALGPIVAALDVAYRRGAGDLPRLMASQVEATRHRVAVMRDLHAARAKHRRAMALLLGLFAASILTLMAVWPTFLTAYRPLAGQLVLAGIGLTVIGAVRSLIQMSRPAPTPDFFTRPPDVAAISVDQAGDLP
ncbi:type II secretion system F family protein [Candidatus Protofrankia californiensis]|uniref:type II secretion system F family protein n=1 Tax=Candidatus Protofrankia californiensis TaxID=1839754 RepID=UPI001F4990A0|nr:hypothetical protein [Candidatus Protofrankia californiensis]